MASREDYLPKYKEDLTEKAAKVRQVILNLPDYGIDELNDVTKEDYELIIPAVIDSIKGNSIAKKEHSRQQFVEDEFLSPAKDAGLIAEYKDTSKTEKWDFEGRLTKGPKFGLEVKGGEGNSVTLLSRPPDAEIFAVWSHLDVMSNTPADNMQAVLGRVVKQLVNNNEKAEHVDCIIFYDCWHKNGIKELKGGTLLPDVILLPSRIPTKAEPKPPVHKPNEIPLLPILYKVIGGYDDLDNSDVRKHMWLCEIEVVEHKGKWYRKMSVRNCYDPSVTLGLIEGRLCPIKAIEKA